jgi:hypothetical protein
MGDVNHAKKTCMSNSTQALQLRKQVTFVTPSVSRSLLKTTMGGGFMEGVDVEGPTFVSEALDLGF